MDSSENKIKTIEALADILAGEQAAGRTVVIAGGVFDLFHYGHMKHLQTAKREGDILVVLVTCDVYAEKAPGRPVFSEHMRAEMVAAPGIKPGYRILDVGCGKGFLLYEFTQVVPGVEVAGIDISDYAIEHAKEEVKPARPLFSRGQRVSSLGAGRGERRGGAGVCGGIDAIVAVTQG
jgi:cytidyltransferase-like protein